MRALAHLVVVTLLAGCSGEGGGAVVKPELPPLDLVPPGEHDLARLQYNDTNDVYRAFLAGKPPGTPPLRLREVRLALLTDEQIAKGRRPHLENDGNGPLAVVGPRFRIGLLHGVLEERMDADAVKPENVIVRMERRTWSPFLVPKFVDGKSLWHTPAVHYPPPLTPGLLVGSGASGPTRAIAFDNYRRANGALPQAVRLEHEGYRFASKAGADEGAEGDDNDDQGDAQRAVDAGPALPPGVLPPQAKDNRVIGAVEGTPANAHRKKLEAEARKKRLEQLKKQNRKKPTP